MCVGGRGTGCGARRTVSGEPPRTRRGVTGNSPARALRTRPCVPSQASVEIPGLQLSNQDYFPYVYFRIDLSLLD